MAATLNQGKAMDDNGIMQDVRELLSQGLNVTETIAKGYAPSAVYRVQRDTRRKSGSYGTSRYDNRPSGCGLEHWAHLEAENRRLRQQLESLECRLADVSEQATAGPLWDRVEELHRTTEEIATYQEQILGELATIRSRTNKLDGELDDLAQLYKDDLLFGMGEPRWRRRS